MRFALFNIRNFIMKKIILLICALFFMLCLVACVAPKDDGTADTDTDIEYTVGLEYLSNGDGTCYVFSIGEAKNVENIIIPPVSPQGETVTGICKGAFFNYGECIENGTAGLKKIKSFVLPDTIEYIGSQAFYSADIASFDLGEGSMTIDYGAFADLKGVDEIVLSPNTVSIGEMAFSGSRLKRLHVPAGVINIGPQAFENCTSLAKVTFEEGDAPLVIESSAFKGCRQIEIITFPARTVEIGSYAFSNCCGLWSVNFPDGLEKLGERAFSGCEMLRGAELPEGIDEIGEGVFSGCRALRSVTLPDDMTELPADFLRNCRLLDKVELPDGLTKIGSSALAYCGQLTELELPDGLVTLESDALAGLSITELVIPDSVTTIGKGVLSYCRELERVRLPSGMSRVPEYMFSYCSSLCSITLPDGVKHIGSYAFLSCEKLSKINFPEGLSGISSHAFAYCPNLKEVTLPNSITYLGLDCFSSELENIYYQGLNEQFEKVEIDIANTIFFSNRLVFLEQ